MFSFITEDTYEFHRGSYLIRFWVAGKVEEGPSEKVQEELLKHLLTFERMTPSPSDPGKYMADLSVYLLMYEGVSAVEVKFTSRTGVMTKTLGRVHYKDWP